MLNNGDVVQIINEEHRWFPCLLIVDKVKSYGVEAYTITPTFIGGISSITTAPTQLLDSDIKFIGHSKVIIE